MGRVTAELDRKKTPAEPTPFTSPEPPLKRVKEEISPAKTPSSASSKSTAAATVAPTTGTTAADSFDFESELRAIAARVSHEDSVFPNKTTNSTMGLMDDRLFDDDDFDSTPAATTLGALSFQPDILPKADTNEDSARETMNLVEKLRMQYAQKNQPSTANDPVAPPTAPSQLSS